MNLVISNPDTFEQDALEAFSQKGAFSLESKLATEARQLPNQQNINKADLCHAALIIVMRFIAPKKISDSAKDELIISGITQRLSNTNPDIKPQNIQDLLTHRLSLFRNMSLQARERIHAADKLLIPFSSAFDNDCFNTQPFESLQQAYLASIVDASIPDVPTGVKAQIEFTHSICIEFPYAMSRLTSSVLSDVVSTNKIGNG